MRTLGDLENLPNIGTAGVRACARQIVRGDGRRRPAAEREEPRAEAAISLAGRRGSHPKNWLLLSRRGSSIAAVKAASL